MFPEIRIISGCKFCDVEMRDGLRVAPLRVRRQSQGSMLIQRQLASLFVKCRPWNRIVMHCRCASDSERLRSSY
uniref:Uncharacterized protein n=1 Tax=Syphacia muris TaxID=451379 RepID=A0A0N5A7K6_9BILA